LLAFLSIALLEDDSQGTASNEGILVDETRSFIQPAVDLVDCSSPTIHFHG
jgi:hypothetical protein